jgi:hypothetical protein
MTEEIVLSASSVDTYWKCHWRWALANLYRLPSRPTLPMILGTVVHAAAEAIFTSPLSPVSVLRTAFIRETAGLSAQEMNADPGALSDGEAMLATYMREVVPTFTPTMTEAPFTIRAEGTIITGIIDAADENDVHDTKTTALISKFRPESYSVQMTLYSWGYAALTGRAPKRLLLDVLPRGGKVTYRQVEVQPAHGEVRDLIRLTVSAIMQRDFSPTGLLNGSCQFCPYTKVCEFYVP